MEIPAGDNHFFSFKPNLDCSLHDGDLRTSGYRSSYLSNGVRRWRLCGRIYHSQTPNATWVSTSDRLKNQLVRFVLPKPEKRVHSSAVLLSCLIMSIGLGEWYVNQKMLLHCPKKSKYEFRATVLHRTCR